jgi:heme/copper-type cytochrome/quinol oxidase subunit 2
MMSLLKSILTVLLTMAAPSLFACAACTGGKTDSAMAAGMNAGIFTLLGVIVFVLVGAASFAFYLVRRASRASQSPTAGHEPVAQPTI